MPDALYDPGSKIRLSCRFEVARVLTDPSTISLKVKDPAGAISTYTYPATVSKESTGVFFKDIVPSSTQIGRWHYKFIGTGACEATSEETFRVREQVIP